MDEGVRLISVPVHVHTPNNEAPMTKAQQAEAISILEAAKEIGKSFYWRFDPDSSIPLKPIGPNCSVGHLAWAKGVHSLPDMESIDEFFDREYGMASSVECELEILNDSISDPEERRTAVIAFIRNLPTEEENSG